MRAEDNPLDLNNLPEDYYSKDGKEAVEGSPSASGAGGGGGYRKKKSSGKEGKEESGKVYECRFCSLKFCKSQALGGHMNRHRQERETETLNRARQLVFGNDTLPPPPHLGAYHPGSHMSDPTLAFRSTPSSLYPPPPRLFSGSSSTSSSPLLQPYIYQSPPRHVTPYPMQYHPATDFSFSHVLNRSNAANQYSGHHNSHGYGSGLGSDSSTNYTCIGAPVGEVGGQSQKEGLNWGRRIDPHHHSVINRFQDGF